jgi:acyl carrier protein
MIDKTQILPFFQDIYVKRVKDHLADPLNPETTLASMGIDSLAMSWLIADIEEKFGVTIYGSDILGFKTVADVTAFIEKAQS